MICFPQGSSAPGYSWAPHPARAARPGGLACIRNCFAPPTYSYEELKADVNLPDAVDRKRKERYLSDDEFERVLGSSQKDFFALPHTGGAVCSGGTCSGGKVSASPRLRYRRTGY